ncbi:MAG TPA: C25 family cysteine peptidase, partial [Candidatus Krumholzibacteria bacterium]|nr:C25 family cysteine peptidase [Candidatus Krumholzibacteria bacterium]
ASPGGAPGVWRLRYGRGSGIRTHFLGVNTPTLVESPDAVLRNVRPLRTPAVVPDMVVITHASLLEQAERFAQHRRAHFPGAATLGHTPEVQVVDVADIYENFSGARVDPLAIRNYLKLLYTQPFPPGETAPRLRYALLFGEATHDPRRLEAGSTPTLVPTVHAWYADPMDAGVEQLSPQHLRRWFAVEDWLGEMDMPRAAGLGNVHAVPDIGVGRLTPRSSAEAQRLVDKIVEYDNSTDFEAWRTRVVLSADDECKPGQGCYEDEHVLGMERLVPRTPESWDIVKIYLTEYDATLGQKPQGRAAFIRAWSDGCALVCYQGHGAPRQLADEVLFLSTDIPALTNGRQLPVFMAFSCTVAEFDAPELQSMCEDMIASSAGGAVAAMAATQLTFADANADYNVEIWDAMFVDGTTSKVPLGTIHMLGKSRSPASDGLNNEAYVLLGDPSLVLQSPEAEVTFTSGADSLQAGTSARVEAMVHLPGQTVPLDSFDGSADVEVLGSADDSGYQSPVTPFVRIPYDLPGPPLYRGRVSVQDGLFAFQFVVPLGAKLGAKARLSAYGFAASEGNDAKGAAEAVRVVRAAVPDSSLGSPRIRLYFQNNLTQVKPGTQLFGEIRDENGINIQGTTLPSSILLDFDERNQPLNVTAQFRYAEGSDSVGTVSVPLPEGLAAGGHKATLIASDNLQNRSTQSLDFQVVPASAELMANVVAFPNPFKDRTFFFFELTDPADVLLRVFTSSGREVWRYESFVDTPQQVSIRWDGLDFARDPLANGTYLYRVEARPRRDTPGEGPVLKHVGKVVIMRD